METTELITLAAIRRLLRATLAFVFMAIGAAAAVSDVHASASLTTRLVPLDGERVRVDVINDGTVALEIQTRDTPFDAVHAHPLLLVDRSLKHWTPMSRLAYVGRRAKREAPQAHEVMVLHPGELASAIVDVGSNYRIEHAEPYRIRLAHAWQLRALDGARARTTDDLFTVHSKAQTVLTLTPRSSAALRARPPSFDGCSVSEQNAITAANEVAERITNEAVSALAGVTGTQRRNSPRYQTWFGEHNSDRYSRVQDNLSAISAALADQTVRYVCGCSEAGVFAYVFPTRAYDIYLCPAFWRASIAGTDSRAGTIVHELSHFRVVANTDDHRYSHSGTQQLALSSPELAIDNADSHEYFAENTPFIAMAGEQDSAELPSDDSTTETDPNDILLPGQLAQGDVEDSETLIYRVSGATRVRLDSLSGDADLVVWSDAEQTDIACDSIARAPVSDACDVPTEDIWVGVIGFAAGEFRLVVQSDSTPGTSSLAVSGSVVDGQLVSGSLEQGEFDAYAVNGESTVIVESLDGGDVDLYTFSGYEATLDRLACSSNSALESDVARVETCVLDAQDVHLALVFGFRAGEYQLRVEGGSSVAPVLPEEPVTIADEPDDDEVSGGSAGGGCAIGGTAASGAGGAVPLAAVFLMLLGFSRRRWVATSLLGVVAMSAACVPAGVAVANEKLSMGMESTDPTTSWISVWIHNGGTESVQFLVWNSPFESPLSADVFDVRREGQAVEYIGRLVKRGEPDEQAWLSLQPGERLEVELDLALAYELSTAGRYRVALTTEADSELPRFALMVRPSLQITVATPPIELELPR